MSDPAELPPVPRPAQPVSPSDPAPAFPAPPEFTVGAAPVPAPPPAFAAPDPVFAAPDLAFPAPDPAYTATPTAPDPATSPYPASPYAASPYPASPYAAAPYTAAPYGGPTYYPAPGPPPYQAGYGGYGAMPGYPMYVPQTKTNGMAIGSMATSIVGATLLFCYGAGLPLGLVGAILGHVSRRQIKSRGEAGDGMALAGIIIGWIVAGIGLLVVAGVVWFFAWLSTIPPAPDQ
jgi:hypothetical protein